MTFGNTRELLKKTILIFLSTAFALTLAEALTRVYIFGWDGLKYSKIKTYVDLRSAAILEHSSERKVSYQLKPDWDREFRFNSLKTNTQGLRDEEYAFEKPANTIRIAILGDSYTMGWGVERGHSYPDRLEEALNNTSARKYEVINFGVPGYNLENYLGVLTHKALLYKPDLILIGFCEKNDFDKPRNKELVVQLNDGRESNGFYRSYLLAYIKKR